MLGSVLTFAKLFAEKSISQFMITIVIFFLIMMFAPDSLSEFIADKSGVPYAMQIFSFSLAFIISLILRALFDIALYLFPDYCEQRRERRKYRAINRIIDNLNDEEKILLSACLSNSTPTSLQKRNSKVAKSLVEKGVLIPPSAIIIKHVQQHLPFQVSPEFWPYLIKRWDALEQKLK
ncbi:super-infection exclusion protein B [Citrobacter braakii]|uniref:super-infection exclusion protein B n=1 Tax=Citrobacter braakii TaxID=57706 RepID=UPI002B24C561|nr:super-infection exclusion protein B [Citrobacter braakii]MEB0968300.1 super-infection exclusion protein B [Citrobacter braakii]